MVPRVAERMEGSVVGAERWLSAKVDFFNGDGLVAALGLTGCAGRAAGVVSTDLVSRGLAKPGTVSPLAFDCDGVVRGGSTLDLSKAVCGAGLRGSDGRAPPLPVGAADCPRRFGWGSVAEDFGKSARLPGWAGASPGTAGRSPRSEEVLPLEVNPFSVGEKALLFAVSPEREELASVGFLGLFVAPGKFGTLETVAADELDFGLTGFGLPGSANPFPAAELFAA